MSTATATATHPSVASEPDRVRAEHEFEVFYDGDCPLCRREIDLLRRFDKRGAVLFTDIAAEDFSTAAVGIDMPTLMAEIHGRTPQGEVTVGVETFRRLYAALGWSWLVWGTRLPGVRQALDVAYRLFAKHRLRLTGRCAAEGDACSVAEPTPPATPPHAAEAQRG